MDENGHEGLSELSYTILQGLVHLKFERIGGIWILAEFGFELDDADTTPGAAVIARDVWQTVTGQNHFELRLEFGDGREEISGHDAISSTELFHQADVDPDVIFGFLEDTKPFSFGPGEFRSGSIARRAFLREERNG